MPPLSRIACLDLDTFFVSVERLLSPDLVGEPVIVGGGPGRRGVVTSASYEVRAFGVRSGMSMGEATRLAPDAICVTTRHGVYGPYAAQVRAILDRWCPVVQTASIDEFFLDFRGCEGMYRTPTDRDDEATIERVVRQLREAIQSEVGLPASVGIGSTRPVAKMASGKAKPAGVLLVSAGREVAFAGALPVRKFPGIGPVAEEKLVAAGITTLADLLPVRPAIEASFARVAAAVRAALMPTETTVLGRDQLAFHEYDPEGATGTLSNERTFARDVRDVRLLEDQLRALSERVAWRVRQRGCVARTVELKIRRADFTNRLRSRTVPATQIEGRVYQVVRALFHEEWSGQAIRLLGVGLSNLVTQPAQLALPLGSQAPQAHTAIDGVRAKFGYDAIRLGALAKR
ncbi:MAG: DNA polymerase IV [Deltaproteobacteria bacterium]|nr:DNA polymerase IV [Deltaproteobacteria bacterium]